MTLIDDDDHHDDVMNYLKSMSKEDLIALGQELGLKNKRLTKMKDVAGNTLRIQYHGSAVQRLISY